MKCNGLSERIEYYGNKLPITEIIAGKEFNMKKTLVCLVVFTVLLVANICVAPSPGNWTKWHVVKVYWKPQGNGFTNGRGSEGAWKK